MPKASIRSAGPEEALLRLGGLLRLLSRSRSRRRIRGRSTGAARGLLLRFLFRLRQGVVLGSLGLLFARLLGVAHLVAAFRLGHVVLRVCFGFLQLKLIL